MVIDSSALIALVEEEPEAAIFAEAIARSPASFLSAATFLETSIVVDRRGDAILSRRLDDLLVESEIEILSLTPEQAILARAAHRDFGRGTGHPAQLNMGDCFSYALAKSRREPLLFKGDDFIHTDIRSAI